MNAKRFHLALACAAVAAVSLLGGCSSKPSSTTGGGKPAASHGDSTKHDDHTPGDGHKHDQPAAHDPDDVPLTEKDIDMPKDYPALVARVEQLVGDIRDKIAGGTPTKAHRSLDELDIILKKTAEIASRGVAKEHWKAVNVQSKELAAAHNELHEKIDEKQNPDYSAVADRIQKALDALKAVPAI